ncbi:XAC2610-related protein [Fusibacter bizertensis]
MITNESEVSDILTTEQDTNTSLERQLYDNNDIYYSFEILNSNDKPQLHIEMEAIPNNGEDIWEVERELVISIFNINNMEVPIQLIYSNTLGTLFRDVEIVDANFDGYLDFNYVYTRGTANYFCTFWLWDPHQNKFVYNDQLGELSMPSFDEENQIISAYWHGSAASGDDGFYRFIDGQLKCIRYFSKCYPDSNGNGEYIQKLIVKDLVNGELIEVFNKEAVLVDDFEGEVYEEFFKWFDIEYKGEKVK